MVTGEKCTAVPELVEGKSVPELVEGVAPLLNVHEC